MGKLLLSLCAALMLLMPTSPVLAEGAIAVDHVTGTPPEDVGYGVGWGNGRAAAERNALRQCRSAGNDNCKVIVWFETCGAYVGSRTAYGYGWGATEAVAKKNAFANCKGNCRLVVSACE